MDTDAMTDYYWENLKDILQRQLADDDEYHALIQKKITAENALKALISEEAWSLYLELDAISNELESVRQEAMWQVLPITKNYPSDLDAADVRHFLFVRGRWHWQQHG